MGSFAGAEFAAAFSEDPGGRSVTSGREISHHRVVVNKATLYDSSRRSHKVAVKPSSIAFEKSS